MIIDRYFECPIDDGEQGVAWLELEEENYYLYVLMILSVFVEKYFLILVNSFLFLQYFKILVKLNFFDEF